MSLIDHEVDIFRQDQFDCKRAMFDASQAANPYEPVLLDLCGPSARIQMIAERLAHSEVVPAADEGESRMWVVGVFDRYVHEKERSISCGDYFTFYGADANGEPIEVAIEASYMQDVQPLAEAA